MKFIKNNIKIIIFILVFIIIFVLFNIFFNREVDYTLEYTYDDYNVIETYNKNDNMYKYTISIDDHTYEFAFDHKYSRKRKLIDNINSFDRDDYKCVSISIYNNESNIICNKDKDYYDNNITNAIDNNSNDNLSIFNDSYTYLLWNGYGLTDIKNNKEYNFLSNESYTNNLYYQFDDYIVFADYDQKREFNKFYIYDNTKKEIKTWEFNIKISHDSYFLGHIGEDLYLYDVASETEYRINIPKRRMKRVSKNDMVLYYDNGISYVNKGLLIYNMTPFKYNNQYNFNLLEDELYYTYYDSAKRIRISDKSIKSIIYSDKDRVYYISDNKLYVYDINKGEEVLVQYFEWNFDYNNKIYVF